MSVARDPQPVHAPDRVYAVRPGSVRALVPADDGHDVASRLVSTMGHGPQHPSLSMLCCSRVLGFLGSLLNAVSLNMSIPPVDAVIVHVLASPVVPFTSVGWPSASVRRRFGSPRWLMLWLLVLWFGVLMWFLLCGLGVMMWFLPFGLMLLLWFLPFGLGVLLWILPFGLGVLLCFPCRPCQSHNYNVLTQPLPVLIRK